MKKRLDVMLFERGLADSREKAKRLIMAGIVYVAGRSRELGQIVGLGGSVLVGGGRDMVLGGQ